MQSFFLVPSPQWILHQRLLATERLNSKLFWSPLPGPETHQRPLHLSCLLLNDELLDLEVKCEHVYEGYGGKETATWSAAGLFTHGSHSPQSIQTCQTYGNMLWYDCGGTPV